MLYRNMVSSASLMAGLFAGQMALADVTAQEVWDNMVRMAAMSNETLTGTLSQKGDTLTVNDTVLTYIDDEGTTVTVPLGTMTLEEKRNGSVEINSPDSYQMLVNVAPEDGEKVEIVIDVTQSDADIIASGSREAMKMTYEFGKIELDVSSLTVDGEKVDAKISGTLNDLDGAYEMTPNGGMILTKSEMSLSSADATVKATPPAEEGAEKEGHLNLELTIADVASASKATMPENVDPTDFGAMVEAGLDTTGTLTHGAVTMAIDFADKMETGQVNASVASGLIDFGLVGGVVSYRNTYRDTSISASGSNIPLPMVAFGLAETDFNIQMPLAKGDEPQDFTFLTALRGLTISEDLWGLFDPAGQLPHDPVNLVIDLAGKGNWAINLFDQDEAKTMQGPPGELHELNVNDLELTVAGASLTGKGGFTFDNTDLTTFNGTPAPDGTLNLKLVGGNTLLDTLVAMGLVPEDQVMGMRMMMGLFARPGDGEDTMVSEITVKPDGQVLANGQRLK
ncbi:DUF2125 domain-containing protein [Actibacterium sp. XHP0104]|uniref:DUF2125 domain-containing protein n=1 Tax=Actibacterium sp. XHP0104 TaxID=2984335 RepID=UPI0021E82A7B|nr:DUF2125 domain-containing protein [Actibacterium sp. XHP0104]MCV2881975.1 DUF2125 domain-containing protein [Actibacterium sp. XHP0104]